MQRMKDEFQVMPCPIIGSYNVQRFKQWSPEDTANWYMVKAENGKRPFAMYPQMGRKHINYLGINQLIFGSEPRNIYKTIDYIYVIIGNTIYQYDENYNQVNITPTGIATLAGDVWFTFLVVNNIVFAVFVDEQFIYIYQEGTPALQTVTDPNAPGVFTINGEIAKPGYIAAFGNRIAVSVADSSQFVLSAINLVGNGASPAPGYAFDPAKCFTNFTTPQVFAQEEGKIRQMGVLNNTLYIFCDYVIGVWSNITAVFTGTQVTFPWKRNSTYNFNFGIANPASLDIDFGYMVWLARNSDGLLKFMVTQGGQPEPISDKAINTLLQRFTNLYGINNPFLSKNASGFIYQYEDTVFYRMSGGEYTNSEILDEDLNSSSIEFNFETEKWARCIELNGQRNRVQKHIYFNFKHLVTLIDDHTIYDMSGQYYFNEIRNPLQPDPQQNDAYIAEPFRYVRTTPIISEQDYSEFETEYVQIDFVFGDSNLVSFTLDDPNLYKPHVELYFSDDGGVSFDPADIREFSQMGVYSWRMRWYQLGASRNRVYKLICVSDVPIVILGGVMNVRRISGGAN
jgi:hypothetical protein